MLMSLLGGFLGGLAGCGGALLLVWWLIAGFELRADDEQ